ncbi:MAG TPA: HAD family phosphatase [Dinghuibacter sp.]|uniref:HAD family hydrolase n=1 Tax=Dinghuibacter sp. TaxID=2024697 RepID=UPI002C9C5C45|nr:HAD family phosphatase [Dinghuibacter sp.]HTJ13208.1 HAD family phosphatase [Dinghuibacter sp.]
MSNAFLFDLNGTMIDDMEYHVRAWTSLLNEDLKAGLTDAYIRGQMYGKNEELFHRVFGPGRFTKEEINNYSQEKERRYQQTYKPHLRLIDGLDGFLGTAHAEGIALGIGTAAIPFNLDFVLDNLHLRELFQAVVTADDVAVSKPDPEVYLACAAILNTPPARCLVFEDAPKGVEAALNAGMKAVVILSTLHGPDEFKKYPNVVKMIHNYTEVTPAGLLATIG